MKFDAQKTIDQQGVEVWEVVCLDDNFVWERHATEEEAGESAERYQDESDCKDAIRDELETVVEQMPYRFERFSRDEIRVLIEEVADAAGY